MNKDKKIEQEAAAVSDKTEPYKLSVTDVLNHRKQVKAAVGTAKVVTGDQVKAAKVKAPTAKD